MKIKYIKLNNFLSFGESYVPFDENRNIIVGANNSGKSNLVRTLKFILDIISHRIPSENLNNFCHMYSNYRTFELEIGYELDRYERKDLKTFSEIYVKSVKEFNQRFERIIWDQIFSFLTPFKDVEGALRKFNDYMFKVFQRAVKNLSVLICEKISSGSIIISYRGDFPYPLFKFNLDGKELQYNVHNQIGIDFNPPVHFPQRLVLRNSRRINTSR